MPPLSSSLPFPAVARVLRVGAGGGVVGIGAAAARVGSGGPDIE
jgi:hypothetical protein